MNRALSVCLLLAFIGITQAHAQTRLVGAGGIILDDGSGNNLLLLPPDQTAPWSGSVNWTLPLPPAGNPPSGFVNRGTLSGQTLIWDNTGTGQWVPSGSSSFDTTTYLRTFGDQSVAGSLAITATSTTPGLSSTMTGTSNAGLFTISNSASDANALEATTNGTGWAGAFFGGAYIKGKGTTSSTQAMRVESSAGSTILRVFDNGNAALGTFSALNYGGYASVGTLANKRGLTIASSTSYRADAPAVLELVGSAANVGEELGMIDFIHQSSNSSVYDVARITAVRENTNPTFTGIAFYTRQFSTLSEVMRIANTGNVGIGCNAPQYKLQVAGDIAAQGGIVRASSVTISTAITACSDARYKKDIHPLEGALSNVLKMEGVSYRLKTKEFPDKYFPSSEQLGFIAQDVEKYYPQVVVTGDDGYKSIDYTRFAPILVQAIKEQQKTIDAQRSEMDALRKEMQEMKSFVYRRVAK